MRRPLGSALTKWRSAQSTHGFINQRKEERGRSMQRSEVQSTVNWLHNRLSQRGLRPLSRQQAERATLAAPKTGRSSNPNDLPTPAKHRTGPHPQLAATEAAVWLCCGHGDNGHGCIPRRRLRFRRGCAHGRATRRPSCQRACSSPAANRPKHVGNAASQEHHSAICNRYASYRTGRAVSRKQRAYSSRGR